MLSTAPDDPTNVVLVTHQDLILPLIKSLRRDQLKEGDAFVVKPEGEGKFAIIAQVTQEDWTNLAADEAVRDAAAAAKTARPAKSSKPATPSKKTAKAGTSTAK
jgi:hypothetical protein